MPILKHLSQIIRKQLHIEVEEMPGAGAAGGLGAGIVAFLKGTLNPGFELISRIIGTGGPDSLGRPGDHG